MSKTSSFIYLFAFLKLVFSLNQLLGRVSQLLGNANSDCFPNKIFGISYPNDQRAAARAAFTLRHNTPDTTPTGIFTPPQQLSKHQEAINFLKNWQQNWPNRMARKRIKGSVCCRWFFALPWVLLAAVYSAFM